MQLGETGRESTSRLSLFFAMYRIRWARKIVMLIANDAGQYCCPRGPHKRFAAIEFVLHDCDSVDDDLDILTRTNANR